MKNSPSYIEAKDLKVGSEFTTQSEWDDYMAHGTQPGVFTVLGISGEGTVKKLKVAYREPGVFAVDVKHYPNGERLITV